VQDTVAFSMHFIDKALNAVKKIDKEKILIFNEAEIDDMQKKIAELKEYYITVKSEIENIEQKEQTSIQKIIKI
jgi:molecular chaperone GrpE (heat shock protein)